MTPWNWLGQRRAAARFRRAADAPVSAESVAELRRRAESGEAPAVRLRDPNLAPNCREVHESKLAVRHLARRDDDVAAWLERKRDEVQAFGDGWPVICGAAIDDLLDDYQAHADTGTPLGAEVQER